MIVDQIAIIFWSIYGNVILRKILELKQCNISTDFFFWELALVKLCFGQNLMQKSILHICTTLLDENFWNFVHITGHPHMGPISNDLWKIPAFLSRNLFHFLLHSYCTTWGISVFSLQFIKIILQENEEIKKKLELYKEGPETYQFGHQKESVYYSWAIRKFCLTIKIYIYDSSAIDTRGLYLLVMGQALKIQT